MIAVRLSKVINKADPVLAPILQYSQYSGYQPACSQSKMATILCEPGDPATMMLHRLRSPCVKYTLIPVSGSRSRYMSG